MPSTPLARFGLTLTFAALVLSVNAPASRAATPPGTTGLEQSVAVIELYIGDDEFPKTPQYAERVQESLAEVAKNYALLARSDAARQLGDMGGGGMASVSKAELEAIDKALEPLQDLIFSKPKRALDDVKELAKRVEKLAQEHPIDPELRQRYFRVHVNLALAYMFSEDDAAFEKTVADTIRFMGDADLDRDKYHPRLVETWDDTYKKLLKEASGELRVVTKPEGATVFINGKSVERRTPMTAKVLPGKKSVVARSGSATITRIVTIEPGGREKIEIDLEVEQAMQFGGGKFGLYFPDRAAFKRRGPELAAMIGDKLQVDRVVLIGLTRQNDTDYLEGYMVDVASQQVILSDKLVTKANVVSRNRVTQLATYFGIGTKPEVKYEPWYTNWVGWLGIGVFVAGTALGTAMYFDFADKLEQVQCTDPPETSDCKSRDERLVIASEAQTSQGLMIGGFIGAGVGLVGGIVAFVLMKEEDMGDIEAAEPGIPRLQAIGPIIDPDGATGLGATFSF